MSERLVHKWCPDCGTEMLCYPQTQRCPDCVRKREREREIQRRAAQDWEGTVRRAHSIIASINQEARIAGMSYGRYVAARGL